MKSTKQNDWQKFHQSIDDDRNMAIQVCSIQTNDFQKTLFTFIGSYHSSDEKSWNIETHIVNPASDRSTEISF